MDWLDFLTFIAQLIISFVVGGTLVAMTYAVITAIKRSR
jgi:hypothetical protein